MANPPLRIGILGLGFMGRTYFGCLRSSTTAQVVAICDRDPDLRAGRWDRPTGNLKTLTAERPDLTGIAAHATPEELLADSRVQAVAVTLPTPLHADVTVAALRAGKHVLCEKPMAVELDACTRMLRAADEAQRTLMVAQCIRFWPQYELIRKLAADGRIGDLRFAKLWRVTTAPEYASDGWLLNGAASGGALLDLHVHDVDFVNGWLGCPTTIAAQGCTGPSGAIDHVAALWTYAGGPLVQLEGSWLYGKPWEFEMAIIVSGTRGTLAWSSRSRPEVLLYAGGSGPEPLAAGAESAWTREIEYFVACVRAGRPPARCLPASTRDSIALALLEKAAIESGKVQRVPARLA